MPAANLKNKTILLYRDGPFRGEEVNHLLTRANAIRAKLILVECYKRGIPRLYNLKDGSLTAPSRGLALRLSSQEAIVVTTQVQENVGVPYPIRLKIRPEGEQVDIESLVDVSLKLTLLHHGALKDPRLPIPLFGSDRIARRKLQGISPISSEGDRQYWL